MLLFIAKTLNVVTIIVFLIKCKYEKPKKWAKLRQEFDLEDQHIVEAVLLPIGISSKPYLRTFQYIKY